VPFLPGISLREKRVQIASDGRREIAGWDGKGYFTDWSRIVRGAGSCHKECNMCTMPGLLTNTVPEMTRRMKVKNVNQRDLQGAITLGCQTMSQVFDADDSDIPFFRSVALPTCWFAFFEMHSESHVPGRHLNALLTAQSLGVSVSEETIEKHARAAFFSFSGPLPLPLNRQEIGGPLQNFLPHNIREGLHALYALIRYRNSEEALEVLERSIAAIFEYWSPSDGWSIEKIEKLGLRFLNPSGTHITGLGRAIGPLVKLFQATGYEPALELARILKDRAMDAFPEDGTYDPIRHGYHTHSTTCVLSSLAQLADLTEDESLMLRVKSFYDNGLREIRDDFGWSIESSSPTASPDRGEVNNSGDIVETALILARWGFTEYYHDVECILRNHMLPSQMRDADFMLPTENPHGEDRLRNVPERNLGAFGFPAPYGHFPLGAPADSVAFNMDIVGGAVASLCEAFREATRFDAAGHWINLLFDHETEEIKVSSIYGRSAFQILLKVPAPLHMRIPPWAASSPITVSPREISWQQKDGYIFVAEPPTDQTIEITMDLPLREVTLKHRTRDIRALLRGDEVIAMENFGAELTYFDPL
jgi:hypothetical protein